MSTTPATTEAINTFQQIGPDGWAITPLHLSIPPFHQCGWQLWRWRRLGDPRQGVRGGSHFTVLEAHELHYSGDRRVARKAALAELMRQAEAITGIPADVWQRNPMGDYVSREVNKARPLRRVEG
jgi:hypothetical protein